MNQENFWNDLERVYADEDNIRFDNERRRNRTKWENRLLIAGLLLAILVGSYVYGLFILNMMPVD